MLPVMFFQDFLAFHDFPRAAAALNQEREEKRSALASSIGLRPSGGSKAKLRLDLVRVMNHAAAPVTLHIITFNFLPDALL